ncbi:MAG: serine/threonine protein phosphatase, partial [Ktedonobacteraceae bacterium]|nr:serine/threonine protein phosphatase [Ktedonobacteraceae bacterium]
PVQAGDKLVLCTDGLVGPGLVSDSEICAIVEQYAPAESVSRLIALTKERGAPDNVSVVVASIE